MLSCSTRAKKANRFYFDYEQAAGWTDVQLEQGFARSGRYCEVVTADKVYSHTFILTLAEAGPASLKKVQANVWIAAPEIQQDITLVIDLFSPALEKSIKHMYKNIPASELQGAGGWRNYTAELDIGEITDGSVMAKVYVWNPNAQKCFLDDFEISFR